MSHIQPQPLVSTCLDPKARQIQLRARAMMAAQSHAQLDLPCSLPQLNGFWWHWAFGLKALAYSHERRCGLVQCRLEHVQCGFTAVCGLPKSTLGHRVACSFASDIASDNATPSYDRYLRQRLMEYIAVLNGEDCRQIAPKLDVDRELLWPVRQRLA